MREYSSFTDLYAAVQLSNTTSQSHVCSCLLCHRLIECMCVGLFLGLCSVQLIHMSVFLDSVLIDCRFIGTCSFLLTCWVCWHIIVHNIILCFVFYFCGISCYFSSFISCFAYLDSLFFIKMTDCHINRYSTYNIYFYVCISFLLKVNIMVPNVIKTSTYFLYCTIKSTKQFQK